MFLYKSVFIKKISDLNVYINLKKTDGYVQENNKNCHNLKLKNNITTV